MCSSRKTNESNISQVTAKCSNIFLNPFEEYNLISET